MRKVMGWHVEHIVQEYMNYANEKVRDTDISYIRGFDIATLAPLVGTLRFEHGARATDSRVSLNVLKTARMGQFTVFTALVLLIWLLTVFCLRT
jgi:hypothetical protein